MPHQPIGITPRDGCPRAPGSRMILIAVGCLSGLVAGFLPRTALAEEPRLTQEIALAPPDKNVRIQFGLRDAANEKAFATYRVVYRDKLLVEESRLGLDFAGSGPFGSGLRIASARLSSAGGHALRLTPAPSDLKLPRYRSER